MKEKFPEQAGILELMYLGCNKQAKPKMACCSSIVAVVLTYRERQCEGPNNYRVLVYQYIPYIHVEGRVNLSLREERKIRKFSSRAITLLMVLAERKMRGSLSILVLLRRCMYMPIASFSAAHLVPRVSVTAPDVRTVTFFIPIATKYYN